MLSVEVDRPYGGGLAAAVAEHEGSRDGAGELVRHELLSLENRITNGKARHFWEWSAA
jgi:hypothetical protein